MSAMTVIPARPGLWQAPFRIAQASEKPVVSKWDERFMDMARLVATWSKDPSTKLGACIVDSKKRIISVGFNGSPVGVGDVDDINERPRKLMRTIHAEANALHFTNRDVTGFTIYVTQPPCSNCAAHMIQRGIAEVVFMKGSEDFMSRWTEDYKEALAMFNEAGVNVREIQ